MNAARICNVPREVGPDLLGTANVFLVRPGYMAGHAAGDTKSAPKLVEMLQQDRGVLNARFKVVPVDAVVHHEHDRIGGPGDPCLLDDAVEVELRVPSGVREARSIDHFERRASPRVILKCLACRCYRLTTRFRLESDIRVGGPVHQKVPQRRLPGTAESH